MCIHFQKDNQIFTLQTEHTTYQFQADAYGFLLHLYYGKKADGEMDYLLTFADRGFSGCPADVGSCRTYSMDALPQEFPCAGTGDYRSPALIVRNGDGTYCCDLRYTGHKIYGGKYSLDGLPAVYAQAEEAQTLEVYMEDPVTHVQAVLLYGVLPKLDIITRSVKLMNSGGERVFVEKAASAAMDFIYGDYELMTFYGRHNMERNVSRIKVGHERLSIGSGRGSSSHQYNPSMILAGENTQEDCGLCYGLTLVYSGNFLGEAQKDQFNQTRILLGLPGDMFSYLLAAGESLIVPETVMTCSTEGFSKLSQNFHKCFRKHLCRGKYRDISRPVLINSWEAAYFNFNGETILNLAREAAGLGIEMVVMDDGWFGRRSDDNSSLGDWTVNEEKLGCSLKTLVENVNGLGLKFGIWVEPEMISEDSELYRAHPDWAFVIPGRGPVRSRNQLVLDFSRREVRDFIYGRLCELLDSANMDYVKWDMNRSIANVFSPEGKDSGQVLYDYVLGVYEVLEKLISRYPNLLIEGCCGGGGRFDAGMLYYTPQIWCSDNTDAIDRTIIQYGTSFIYPAGTMGAHVSTVPNHQTGRSVSMNTRGVVAMAGTFGYELDPGKLDDEEKDKIREQIRAYHKYAPLIAGGDYYRLSNPAADETAAWAFVSEDKTKVLLNVIMLQLHGNMTVNYVRLLGLKEHSLYREEKTGKVYSGAALMWAGLPLPLESGPYRGYQMYFEMI